MLKDQVVTLQPEFALAAAAQAMSGATVLVSISAEAPSGSCRLRLWDSYGRNPVGPPPRPFEGALQYRHALPVPEHGLGGCTLAWTLRLQPSARAQSYKVKVLILQVDAGREEPRGEFAYSGPLDDFEEISGRIHFGVAE